MNTIIEFIIPGVPKAMPRCRYRLIKTKSGKQFVHTYTPTQNIQAWYDIFISESLKHKPEKAIEKAIAVECEFKLPRPKNHFSSKGFLKNSEIYHTKKPDIDNLFKLILDVLKNLNYFIDDAQIAVANLKKIYPQNNSDCGMKIKIQEL